MKERRKSRLSLVLLLKLSFLRELSSRREIALVFNILFFSIVGKEKALQEK